MNSTDDKTINYLNQIIKHSVKALAVLMTLVIIMGVVDVIWTVYQKVSSHPVFILTVNDMLATFGAFMAVLIAIEIFVNITIYLKEDVIHVKIVLATALMAVARKAIILDFKTVSAAHVIGLGILVLALSIGYWLVKRMPPFQLNEMKQVTEPESKEEIQP